MVIALKFEVLKTKIPGGNLGRTREPEGTEMADDRKVVGI